MVDARPFAAAACLAAATISLAAQARAAGEEAPAPECYDALVLAVIARQAPTPIPNCDDCIVMAWPWVMELEVAHTLRGDVRSDRLTVLTIQHTWFRDDLGPGRWWLRRNSNGGFNVLRLSSEAPPPRCAKGTPPARAYLEPATHQTLANYLRDGEKRWGRHPASPEEPPL